MIPENEMKVILDALTAYRNWSKVYDKIPRGDGQLEQVCLPSLPAENMFSLDDTCEFGDKNYSVRQLLAQAKRGSEVGKKFAEAVYEEGQKGSALEQMMQISEDGGAASLYAGRKKIPATALLAAFSQSSEGLKVFKLMDYVMAIHTVTHPK